MLSALLECSGSQTASPTKQLLIHHIKEGIPLEIGIITLEDVPYVVHGPFGCPLHPQSFLQLFFILCRQLAFGHGNSLWLPKKYYTKEVMRRTSNW